MNIEKLLEQGIVKIATQAQDNPQELGQRFCLGLAGKDYPAKTPMLWNSVYNEFGMDIRNIRLVVDSDALEEVVSILKTDPRYVGGDIGVGFKDKAIALLDDCDSDAQVMQAVNVVSWQDGKLTGHNTDGTGFALSLEEILKIKGRGLKGEKVLLLGGGGTTNAIAFALAKRGASIVILNRTVAKAQVLVDRLNDYFGKSIARSGGREQIKAEALTAGTIVSAIDDLNSPLDQYCAIGEITLPANPENIAANLKESREILASLPDSVVIADVMLRNQQTMTLQSATEAGLTTLDGRPMVLYQAIEAFWLVNQSELEKRGKTKLDVESVMKSASKN